MTSAKICLYIAVMAGVTYLIRALPLTLCRQKIKSRFLKSFLFYVPYAVLTAMTVPAVFESTASIYSAIIGFAVAAILSFFGAQLLPVALASCAAVYITEMIMGIWL